MSYFSDLDLVRQEMAEYQFQGATEASDSGAVTPTPETADPVGHALHETFSALDDLIILANRPDTRSLVIAERIALGQLLNRCQLLVSFVTAAEHPKLTVISNLKTGVIR